LAQTRCLPLVLRTHHPATVTTSYTPPHYLLARPSTILSNGIPEIEPWWLGFEILAQIHHPPLISQTRDPATVTTLHAQPPVFSDGMPKIKPQQLDFGFLVQTPPPLHNFFPACYMLLIILFAPF
jgi:hypothetical protein